MVHRHGDKTGRGEAVNKDEDAIVKGSVFLTAAEIAPRIGYGTGKRGAEKVRAQARLGKIPCYIRETRYLFHWPTVIERLNRQRKSIRA